LFQDRGFNTRKTSKNLQAIAAYVNRGGSETVEDERGLTVGEVQQLDALYVWLMNRRKDKRGYLLGTSGR